MTTTKAIKKDLPRQIVSWKDIPNKNYIYMSLALIIFTSGATFLLRNRIPPQVPLYFGLAEGEQQLGSDKSLFIPPLVSLVVVGINLFISFWVNSNFARQILIFSGFFVSLLSFVAVFKIIFLVGNI